MYAITSNQGNPGFGNNVTMQFKHTLNQIHFKGKTDSKNLNVTIAANGIQLVKLNNTGKFTFSKNETPATAWSDVTGAETFTSVNNLVTINTATEATAAQQITDLTDVMMLIPQAVTPWDNTTANAPASQTGAYLAITCHIYHKEGATSVDLYGSESTPKTLFIPFPGTNMNLMGKRITYTLVFGGGYDEKGDPIDRKSVV